MYLEDWIVHRVSLHLSNQLIQLLTNSSYYEGRPNEYDWTATNSCTLGMGVGMLMCAAISISPRLTDLPIAGAETLRLAFRFGTFVGDFSRSLETVVLGEEPKKYVCAMFDVDEEAVQRELDAIQRAEVRGSPGRLFGMTDHDIDNARD